jgi:hypothetical protein
MIRKFKPCNQRHEFLGVECILDRHHVGEHWGPLSERRFLSWAKNLGRVVTPGVTS